MVIIRDGFAEAIRNEIRDVSTDPNKLKERLESLGAIVGQEIAKEFFLEEKTVVTPMGAESTGPFLNPRRTVVVSTKDDYEFFGMGIAKPLRSVHRGYIDFGGTRGPEALKSPLRSITLPDIDNVDTVVIAKSVLATGCTAIILAKKAVETYWPQRLVLASVFYSLQGCEEVQEAFRFAEIFVVGDPEELRSDGMLVPGVGDLDSRLNV